MSCVRRRKAKPCVCRDARRSRFGESTEHYEDRAGIQFYTGNFLKGQVGKGGKTYAHRSALCLETQHFPDSINQPSFPNTVLKPGEKFQSQTVLSFSVIEEK